MGSPASQATTLHPHDHPHAPGVNGAGLGSVQSTHAALPRDVERENIGGRAYYDEHNSGPVRGVQGPGLGSVQNTHAALPRDADLDKMSGY